MVKGCCLQEHQILQKTRRKREGGPRGGGEGARVGRSEGLGEEPEEKGGAIGKGEELDERGGARGKGRSQRKRSQRRRRRGKKDVGSQAWRNWPISI